jgi:Gpi18-like mannosyltransferase
MELRAMSSRAGSVLAAMNDSIEVGSTADKRKFIGFVILLLLCAGVVRLLLAEQYAGFRSDQSLFVQWMGSVREYGLGGAFAANGNINYPPLFLWIMGLYGDLLAALGISTYAGAISFKFLLILIDLAAILLAVKLTESMSNYNWRSFVLVLFALNPALMTDSAVWGQVDMLHSMLMLLAVVLLSNRPFMSGIIFALALLTKFQAITILPVIGIWLLIVLLRERKFRPLLMWITGFVCPWIVTLSYFGAAGSLGEMISQAYTDAVGFYTSATMNAMNIWFYIIGIDPGTNDTQIMAAGISMRNIGFLLLFIAVIGICGYVYRSREESTTVLLKASAALSLAFFMLPTEIHERYSIPALVFTILVLLKDKQWTLPAGLLTLTVLMNLIIVLDNRVTAGTGVWIAIVNVFVLLWMFRSLWVGARRVIVQAQVSKAGEG